MKLEFVNNYKYRGHWNGKLTWLWWYVRNLDFLGGFNLSIGVLGFGFFLYLPPRVADGGKQRAATLLNAIENTDGSEDISKYAAQSQYPKSGEFPGLKENDLFDRCAEIKLMKDGSVQIHCKLGLWSVAGYDRDQVEREARHYWTQYYRDGEYDSLLDKKE